MHWIECRHTLDVRHTLLKDLVEDLGVLELLVDLGNDSVGELLLLAGLDLAFVTNPRVQNVLRLGRDGGLLLKLVCLGLKLSGFLHSIALA